MSLRLPSAAEVRRANAGTPADRRALGRKYGLSGAAAAAVGLQPTQQRGPTMAKAKKANGQLKKGYKYKRGGKVVKVSTKKKRSKKR